jgi:EmrB/QacA subfamily drug resistance transporter
MSTLSHDPQGEAPEVTAPDPRRWLALAVLASMQFMLILDITVVNVALPKIQHDLGFSRQGLAWVVNGFVLMAGGLLLLGGRLSDMYGRRRLFLVGVFVFGAASAVCGFATTSAMLVSGRFAQGLGEAFAGPAALGMIPMLFPDTRERMKAVGIWGGIAALAGTTGTVISGVLTDLAEWRWIFFINIPVVVFALIMVPRVMSESRMDREGHRVDVVGAVTVTGGLVAVVYGLLQAATYSWGSGRVLLPVIGGLVLLAIMVAWETRVTDPMIPLRFLTNRTRVTSNLVSLALMAAFFSLLFLMTLYMQQILGYSPLKAGLAYVPTGIGLGVGMGLATGLMPRIGVKPVLALGFLGAGGSLFLASGIGIHSSYVGGILPGLFLYGVFSGVCYPGMMNGALHRVTGQDSGLGSGVQNAMQQIGAALGLATLVPLALRSAAHHIAHGTSPAVASTDGYALALRVGGVVLVVAALLVLALLEKVDAKPRNALAEAPGEQAPAAPPAGATS